MRYPAAKIDLAYILNHTSTASRLCQNAVETANNILNDPDKDVRKSKSLCKSCHYVRNNTMAGAAMTERSCGICHTSCLYGSTNTDVLCLRCAKSHKLCKHCGGDFNMKKRRKFEPIIVGLESE